MRDQIMPPALVTVLTLPPYGGLHLERFECEFQFRPMYTNPTQLYSVETHREGYTIRDANRSAPVDIATWLHRAGVWDQLPLEP